jgi:hypothetical protein
VTTRVGPAFEAVAGTLTHLHLEKYRELCVGERRRAMSGTRLGWRCAQLRRLEELFAWPV